MQLAISDDHLRLKAALAATLAGTTWPDCRVHFLSNLLTQVPESTQTIVATLVRSIFAQPDEAEVLAQHQRVWSSSPAPSPRPVSCWKRPVRRCWCLPAFPRSTGARSGPTTPGAAQPGDPPAHRCGGHLLQPESRDSTSGRGPGRTERRMDCGSALPRRGVAHRGAQRPVDDGADLLVLAEAS